MINIIVAYSRGRGIGLKNQLPWKLHGDTKHFKEKTIGNGKNGVIMGRKTWYSLPESVRPLHSRHNVIVSSTMKTTPNYTVCKNMDEAIEFSKKHNFDQSWIIGGADIYNAALESTVLDEIHVTNIENDISCDTFFPEIAENYSMWDAGPWKEEKNFKYRFETYIERQRALYGPFSLL